jgi:hypothetical protein
MVPPQLFGERLVLVGGHEVHAGGDRGAPALARRRT